MESLERYKKLTQSLTSKLNGIFSNLTFLTVDEIIKEEVDLRSIWWEVSRIIETSGDERKKIIKELERLPEEEYDDWGYKIEDEVDDLNYKIDWKGMSIQSLLDTMEKLVSLEEEDEILKHFQDIKPINL